MQSAAGHTKHGRGFFIFWLLGIAVGAVAAAWLAPRLMSCCTDRSDTPWSF
jgi:hypothetical protein